MMKNRNRRELGYSLRGVALYMRKNSKIILLMICISISLVFNGCTSVEELKVKLGLKILDFEYIKENKVEQIVIQSTRDSGFRFIVTDKKTIRELYDILSTAKYGIEKSSLEPDYIFEIHQGPEEVRKFNYITGLEKKDTGNFYDGDNVYVVSKRIDNDIVRNLWNLRKPKEFEKVYYTAILNMLQTYNKDINKDGRIGINLSEDIDVAKYIFSTDLEKFKADLNFVINGAELVKQNKDEYDILITVKTLGYKADKYRSMITVYNKKDKSEQKYYSGCKHENGEWNIRVDTKPFTP